MSFDFSSHQYPVGYKSYGASTQINSHFKLIPNVPDRDGIIRLEDVSHFLSIYFLDDFIRK